MEEMLQHHQSDSGTSLPPPGCQGHVLEQSEFLESFFPPAILSPPGMKTAAEKAAVAEPSFNSKVVPASLPTNTPQKRHWMEEM